jgi:tyrosyl-tRNA synthetase
MLERDDFARRFAASRPIHIHEFLYPLLQAYDSVVLECDVELGGTDQLFNLLVGRDLMPRYGVSPQIVMTTPLLEGINARVVDGRVVGDKMSKSADNYVALEEPPLAMLNKLMLVDDQVVWRFMELLWARSADEIAELRRAVEAGRESIIDAKEQFALDLVARYHGRDAADDARTRRRAIAAGGVPADAPEVVVQTEGDGVALAKALQLARLASSMSEASRLVQQGGVQLDGERVLDARRQLKAGARHLVRVGGKNRRFAVLLVR